MIRASKHILKHTNTQKKEMYDCVLNSYKMLVQHYIDLIWDNKIQHKTFLSSKDLPDYNGISHSRWKQVAYKQSSSILRSRFTKRKRKFSKPNIQNISIELDNRLFDIKEGVGFDLFIRITTPFFHPHKKRAITINIPIKNHKQSNKFQNDGWNKRNTIILKKDYVSFIWEKENPIKNDNGKILGLDCGYKKLLACSDNSIYGSDMINIYEKISRKRQGSKAFKRSLKERDNKINEIVNSFILDKGDLKTLIVEDLKNVKHKSKGKISKQFNNKLQRWSYPKVLIALERHSETKGFEFRRVNPAYTSQECSRCGVVKKENRQGESYSCSCGLNMDADLNASMNILRRGVYSPPSSKPIT
jgi:IS605 OrfB family transposase